LWFLKQRNFAYNVNLINFRLYKSSGILILIIPLDSFVRPAWALAKTSQSLPTNKDYKIIAGRVKNNRLPGY